ncbi:MAG TPA: beta-L-arabinofuranosidase domain-containing protein, partial [Lachnospiraceae bacterium]|nr:beta-L-arabinofuranosidase domain-containing protein [Lachnospiraceae bacterium]
IPYQEKVLNDLLPETPKSGAINNFRIAAQVLEEGKTNEEFYGMVFQDSDVAKWIEAAAYSLAIRPDIHLEKRIDEMIELIGRAQHQDGYLNTYFTVKEPEKCWTNLHEAHELYCAGHMMEAAVAYYEVTKKDKLLLIMTKMADHIYELFITNKKEGYPGHPEIELALMRLYRVTSDARYKELAEHFINVRGVDSDYYKKEIEKRSWQVWGSDASNKEYAMNQAPIRQLKEATGHSVRAVYLMTGMADVASINHDEQLQHACKRLWKDIVEKKMYLTGGIGSTVLGEAFTKAYDLPNDTAYAETCASVGLIFFARKMLEMEANGEYVDILELALYNCVLAGMQLDGKHFFYVNPLEVIPGISGEVITHKHALAERPKWYGCACCPPNVARLLTSLSEYAWNIKDNTIYSNLYIGGILDLMDSMGVRIKVTGDYPRNGDIKYEFETGSGHNDFTMAIRIPGWCDSARVLLNEQEVYNNGQNEIKDFIHSDHIMFKNGYLYITKDFTSKDKIELLLDMTPSKVYANPAIAANSGKVAIMRGPLVYCVEGVDNSFDVLGLQVLEKEDIKMIEMEPHHDNPLSSSMILTVNGIRMKRSDELYTRKVPEIEEVKITAVPYHVWGNRGLNEMRVWIPIH